MDTARERAKKKKMGNKMDCLTMKCTEREKRTKMQAENNAARKQKQFLFDFIHIHSKLAVLGLITVISDDTNCVKHSLCGCDWKCTAKPHRPNKDNEQVEWRGKQRFAVAELFVCVQRFFQFTTSKRGFVFVWIFIC